MTTATKKGRIASSRPTVGIVSNDLVRQLRESLTRAKKITSDEYRILKWLHPQLDDPAASMVWRFIAAWRKWPTGGMPLTSCEVNELLHLLPPSQY